MKQELLEEIEETKEIIDKAFDERYFILDACCGPKQFWLNKEHPNTLYIDIRETKKGYSKHRNWVVNPDLIMDFRALALSDKKFKLVIWDPPHLKGTTQTGEFTKKYGILSPTNWKDDLKKGFNEIWRVLDDFGVLVFKFNDYDISFKEILSLFPEQPLFGTMSSQRKNSKTRWFTYMKIPNTKTENQDGKK